MIKPTFFPTPADFRNWLEENGLEENELWVGFYKKGSGKPSITWPESVDQALCFGWIDGIRKKYRDDSYMIRFTPRRPKSIWSAKNIASIKRLKEEGLMKPAGLEAFAKLDRKKAGIYSFEQGEIKLPDEYQAIFKKNPKAWKFFKEQVPSYRKLAIHWVTSAKQEATRHRRLNALISDSEAGLHIKQLRRK